MAITGRTVAAAALGIAVVAALVPSWLAVVALALVLLALVLLDIRLAGSVAGLRLRRTGDTSVRLGQTARVDLVVDNPGARAVRGVLRDAWPPSAGVGAPRHRLDLPAGERRRVTITLSPTRRGDRVPDRVTIRSVGPLGLAARQGAPVVPWRLRVLAPFTSRQHLPSRLARLRELDGRAAARTRGQGTEFDALRDYVDGDDVRSIDWRATARRTTVVVRTWRPERDRRVLVVLDTGRTSAGRVGEGPRLDAAIDATLLLVALATHAGDRVDLLAYDRRVRARVTGRVGGATLPAVVDATATLAPSLVETDYAGLVGAVLGGARHDLVVLLTGLDTAAVEEGLRPVLGPLAARARVVVAAVADPRLAELAAGRGDAQAVYDAAAAERERGERARVTELLGRLGVTVVDAPPSEIAPALADAYLALKAAGRL